MMIGNSMYECMSIDVEAESERCTEDDDSQYLLLPPRGVRRVFISR